MKTDLLMLLALRGGVMLGPGRQWRGVHLSTLQGSCSLLQALSQKQRACQCTRLVKALCQMLGL